jgi:hypothetical protein
MTEAEWRACEDPDAMLGYLRGKPSERKLRLFALACCRRIDQLITDPRSREVLKFAERHVEGGLARRKGRPGVVAAAREAWQEAYQRRFSFTDAQERAACLVASNAADAASATLNTAPYSAARYAAAFASFAVAWGAQVASGANPYPDLQECFKRPERTEQARLLREVFGNPFRRVAIDPAWLSWGGGTVARLAQAVYEEHAFDRLSVLADALEDAGCADEQILAHCRGPGPHTRGCWALDLLLGKA